MSIEVYLRDLLQLPVCHGLSESAFETRFYEDYEFHHRVLKAYALKHNLHNGATIRVGGYTYRNVNLYFWDAQNEEIVEPFTQIDDYGSVPPRFVVGDGYFNPNDWLDEVEHNTYVFPARPLINEMKEFAAKYPSEMKMFVEINGSEFAVYYSPGQMKGNWDSCILEFDSGGLNVHPGDPSWRETIVDEELPSAAEPTSDQPLDSVVTAVLDSFKQRAATGQKKYGTNLDRTDLKTLDWIQHMQEELMDATLYLEKLKREFSHIDRPSQQG